MAAVENTAGESWDSPVESLGVTTGALGRRAC
jgi:hypothetical protein